MDDSWLLVYMPRVRFCCRYVSVCVDACMSCVLLYCLFTKINTRDVSASIVSVPAMRSGTNGELLIGHTHGFSMQCDGLILHGNSDRAP